jgi:hypothetical protein
MPLYRMLTEVAFDPDAVKVLTTAYEDVLAWRGGRPFYSDYPWWMIVRFPYWPTGMGGRGTSPVGSGGGSG